MVAKATTDKSASARTILVLGGTGYVGGAVVAQLARQGHHVHFSYHTNKDRAAQLCQTSSSLSARRLDASDPHQFKKTLEELLEPVPRLDALIQCIGVAGDPKLYDEAIVYNEQKLLRIELAEWQQMLDITSTSSFLACQAVSPKMMERGGNIVLVGSIDGIKPMPAPVHYAAAKGAVAAMTPALAKQLGGSNIRVNHIAIGLLENGLSANMPKSLHTEYEQYNASRRSGSADEIAHSILWYALNNTCITGQHIVLDGGL